MRRPEDDEGGFTLIDTLIGVVIMGTTVVALITAMSGLVISGQVHRGSAVLEVAAHNAAQDVIGNVSAKKYLKNAIGTSSIESLSVGDASGFRWFGGVTVDNEVMTIWWIDTSSDVLWVFRARPEEHAARAPVGPLLFCPKDQELTPSSATWGGTPGATPRIEKVEYWDASKKQFVDYDTCERNAKKNCYWTSASNLFDLDPACGPGLYRVTIVVTTTDPRYKGQSTSTQVLVRRGST